MIARKQLESAHKAGLLQAGQVEPLLSFLNRDPDAQDGLHDPEEVHFARGFHDVFISIGLVILFAGYVTGAMYLTGKSTEYMVLVFAGLMALSWVLAEWFSKKLRLALPSILLAACFVISSGLFADAGLAFLLQHDQSVFMDGFLEGKLPDTIIWSNSLSFVFAIAAGWLFYRRFNVPITPAMMMLVAVGLFLFVVGLINRSLLLDYSAFWLFAIGMVSFVVAMMFDMRDPARRSVESDKAFWLHLLAAPLLVHAILSGFSAMPNSGLAALAIIGLIFVLGVVALVIDRRAILASALGYLGFAIGTLLGQINLDKFGIIALTLLALGLFVLMLGSGWSGLRTLVMRPLAGNRFARLVPPVHA